MATIVVRYRPTPERAADNQRLVEDVFEELAHSEPDDFRSAALRLDDGTFSHIAGADDVNPLAGNDALARFQQGLPDRCGEGEAPAPQPATLIGSYRFDIAGEGGLTPVGDPR